MAAAGHGPVSAQQLGACRWLLREEGSGTREAVEHVLLPHLHHLDGDMQPGSTEAIKQGVMHGLGVSILSRFTVAHELAAGRLCEVDIAGLRFERGIRAVFRRDKLLSPAAQRFLATLNFGDAASAAPAP